MTVTTMECPVKTNKNNNEEEEEAAAATFIQLIAKYLDKRNLQSTLTSFLSETQCKSSWKTQTKDLEDVYNQYSNQDSKNLKKLTIQDRVEGEKNQLLLDDRNNNPKFLEQEFQTKDMNKAVTSKVALSSKGDLKISGALKPQVSGSDNSFSSCEDAQNQLGKSKRKKRKAPGKDIDPDSDKTPKHNSLKLEKSLQESLEITKEEEEEEKKKKKKKNTKDKNLIDNKEHKLSICKENGNSIKDNSKPSRTSSKQIENSLQESLEVLTEKEEKKKNSKDKDLIDNDEKKTSTDNSTPKTFLKKKDFGKLDKRLLEVLEVPKEKKKNFEDKDLIDNNEQKTSIDRENRNSIKDNKKLLKTSNKLKNILKMNESLQESLELPKKKRKKEHDAKDQDSGDNDKQISAEKNKKEKKELKKKLQSSGSNATNEVATKNNLKDLAEDTDKSLVDSTPGQKGVKEEEREANISSNTKQKSGEPTTAKAFQRVKVEEVQFVDPRLRDNSYWAKSGAEIGYGAKAEQVLGQVRGKDFRHEKTKKKRGSYKGGMIDLQSHSIKFSYSDEE